MLFHAGGLWRPHSHEGKPPTCKGKPVRGRRERGRGPRTRPPGLHHHPVHAGSRASPRVPVKPCSVPLLGQAVPSVVQRAGGGRRLHPCSPFPGRGGGPTWGNTASASGRTGGRGEGKEAGKLGLGLDARAGGSPPGNPNPSEMWTDIWGQGWGVREEVRMSSLGGWRGGPSKWFSTRALEPSSPGSKLSCGACASVSPATSESGAQEW